MVRRDVKISSVESDELNSNLMPKFALKTCEMYAEQIV